MGVCKKIFHANKPTRWRSVLDRATTLLGYDIVWTRMCCLCELKHEQIKGVVLNFSRL